MTKLLVLGIGSPFGDDQLGWDVVELLQHSPSLQSLIPNRLQLTSCDRPGMRLLELMKSAQTVFLIDAMKAGSAPGTLHRFQNKDIETVGNTLSTHGTGIAEAIKMGEALKVLPQTIILYGIDIGDIQFQFSLSEPIVKAVHELSILIASEILNLEKILP